MLFDFLQTDYRYDVGEIHKGNILSALFLFKLMTSYSLSNKLKINIKVPSHLLTSMIYIVLYLVLSILMVITRTDTKFLYIYIAIMITYAWDYLLIIRSDV